MKHYFTDLLLVDDDPVSNFIHENLLEEMQVSRHIGIAYNGKEALAYIEEHWHDENKPVAHFPEKLILLDINMPVMDGFEFLENYQKIARKDEILVAILSSSNNEKDLQKASGFQVRHYLQKPLDKEKLMQLLQVSP